MGGRLDRAIMGETTLNRRNVFYYRFFITDVPPDLLSNQTP